MKKTLLINGCSYTAGDDIAWDHLTYGSWGVFTSSSTLLNKDNIMHEYLTSVRPLYNVSGVLGKLLNTTSVDLSRDGNNNSEIAIKTIGYISALAKEERKNLHVCIGWTEPVRLCRWSDNTAGFVTINPYMLEMWGSHKDPNHIDTLLYKEFNDSTMPWLASVKDVDVFVNDIFRVLAVENYLKSEGITYTFWKSLGFQIIDSDFENLSKKVGTNLNTLFSNDDWIKFTEDKFHPYFSKAWRNTILDSDIKKYMTNGFHPTKIAVEELCSKIVNQIRQTIP
jgi:hypothetical protein